eukprot:3231983-Rhodomonas_salina.2
MSSGSRAGIQPMRNSGRICERGHVTLSVVTSHAIGGHVSRSKWSRHTLSGHAALDSRVVTSQATRLSVTSVRAT